MGNAVFKNFKISDSIRAGFQLHKTNFSKEEVKGLLVYNKFL